jgi:hypothetical protein
MGVGGNHFRNLDCLAKAVLMHAKISDFEPYVPSSRQFQEFLYQDSSVPIQYTYCMRLVSKT